MSVRVAVGIAGIAVGAVAAVAIGRALSNRDEDTRSPNPWVPIPAFDTPEVTPYGSGVEVAAVAARLVAAHDKNHDGHIDLSPKPYDKDIQERLTSAQADSLAASDERITGYRGDVTASAGRDLNAHSDLKLLMAAAQSAARSRGEALDDTLLGHLQLTQPELEHEIARQFDANGNGRLEPGEARVLNGKYPGESVNFRWIRVLHAGEWMGADPTDLEGDPHTHADGSVHHHESE